MCHGEKQIIANAPSCSIVCSTLHKATHPATEPPPSDPEPIRTVQKDNNIPRPGTISAAGYKGPFAALEDSKDLKMLFELYPTLPSLLSEIHSTTLRPMDEMGSSAQSKSRSSNGHYRSHRKEWNQDRGLQDGVEALRQARRLMGKDGEGVREYSKLILQIVSQDATVDAKAIIQKELAEEDARIVSLLLNGEI